MNNSGQQYYGLIASLPPLVRQGQEGYRMFNLANQYESLLDPADTRVLRLAYMPVDHTNILYKLTGSKHFALNGNYDEDKIRRIAEGEDCPYPYLVEFLDSDTTLSRNLDLPTLEARLFTLYYRYLLRQDNPVLRQWAWWQLRIREQTLRNLSQDAAIQPHAELEALEQTWPAGLFDGNFADRDLPEDLALVLRNPDHLQRETDTDQWLWDQLEHGLIFDPFSVDALINYALRQQICVRWSGFYGKNHSVVLEGMLEDLLQELTT